MVQVSRVRSGCGDQCDPRPGGKCKSRGEVGTRLRDLNEITITTLCNIPIGIEAVAEAAAKIPKGADGSRWVSVPAGAMIRVSDVRAMERKLKELENKP